MPRHIFADLAELRSAIGNLEDRQRSAADTAALAELRSAIGSLEDRQCSTADAADELRRSSGHVQQSLRTTLQAVVDLQASVDGFRDALAPAILGVRRRMEEVEASRVLAHRQLIEEVKRQADEIMRQTTEQRELAAFLRLQTKIFPTFPWDLDVAARVRAVLVLLQPCKATGTDKIRLGRDRDGGYVLLNKFDHIGAALSLGIADDASWDEDVAARGIRVLQFDSRIANSPISHGAISFEALRISPADIPGSISIPTIIKSQIQDRESKLLLKMDIEGAEWEILAALPEEVLRRFSQIVCEFHTLDRLGEPDFCDMAHATFAALARTHFVCHVHGNNCGNIANVGNIPVPQSLEVTFASREDFQPASTDELFPTSLDRPNEPGRADIHLGCFRFG